MSDHTSHVPRVIRWFGLDAGEPDSVHRPPDLPLPAAGEVMLITGPSGAGKTRLLRRLVADAVVDPAVRVVDLDAIDVPDRPVVDCFDHAPLQSTLRLLSRCGLGEAWTYLRTPTQLSEGQRWRLRLAVALSEVESATGPGVARTVLVADEFAAVLDRVTACVVARSVRCIVQATGVGFVCATSHDDLLAALQPDVVVRCDFGEVRVTRRGTGSHG